MWLFTKYGFYSAVCARQGDGDPDQPVDPDRVMVRARMRGHLESLIDSFSHLLVDCDILHTTDTDYAYRIFVDKSTWSQVVAEMVDDMDYDNFKGAVAEHQGNADYKESLCNVWSIMDGLQS